MKFIDSLNLFSIQVPRRAKSAIPKADGEHVPVAKQDHPEAHQHLAHCRTKGKFRLPRNIFFLIKQISDRIASLLVIDVNHIFLLRKSFYYWMQYFSCSCLKTETIMKYQCWFDLSAVLHF